MKRQQDIQGILEDFKKCTKYPGNQICKEESTQRKRKNDKGECITSREGIADDIVEFYKRLYEDNVKDDSEHEMDDDDNYSNTDVHNNNTEETTGSPEITTEELQTAITNSKKKVNHQTAKEFEAKTLKILMRRRGKW